jgi:isopenicillin N synthase-like dioxygenase
LRTSQLP